MLPKTPIDPLEAYVLVVDDNLHDLVLICRLLASVGIEIQRYESATSGWWLEDFADIMPRIDLVLMDLNLPYEDGYNILTRLRQNRRFLNTCIVAITADANPGNMKKAKIAGFDGFIGKPIDPDQFPKQIVDILQGKMVWCLGVDSSQV